MPELPEVETIRGDLERAITGRTVHAIRCTGRCIRRHATAEEFAGRLIGRTVAAVERRGKYLVVRLDDADDGPGADCLVVHLGMSGQLLWASATDPAPKHTHVVIQFDQSGGQDAELRYVDPRTFGEVFATAGGVPGLAELPELAHLGVDPLSPSLTPTRLGEMLLARRTRIKALLMDQRFLAGLGNIYTDEILWAAMLRYDRAAQSLNPEEARRLHRAITQTLTEAVEHRGSSLADEQYRDLFGEVGGYQSRHNVYARHGQPCSRCATVIERLKWQGRSTFFCPRCQAPPPAPPPPLPNFER